jgi:cytochrome b561
MTTDTAFTRYAVPAIVLHWAVALIIFVSFPVGLYMVDLPLSPWKLKIYSYHKWAGVTVFLLVLARILWRATHAPPALPGNLRPWERSLAGATHMLLYLLLVAIPLTGWLFSSAAGVQTVYFGVIPLPNLLGKDKMLADLFRFIHMFLNFTLAGLVTLHIAAAIKHHFLDRDTVLSRMAPWLNPRQAQ